VYLQLTTLFLAVQWLGSPWQLGLWKAVVASIFFLSMIFLSVLPAMFREWGNVKKRILIFALLQILCIIFNFLLTPVVGFIISFIVNLVYIFMPVTFYKYLGTGFLIFFSWFIGINHLLGNFLLTDPRGVWSGDSYLTITDWAILGVFIIALARTVYHIVISYPIFKKYEGYDISYILDLAKSPNSSKLKTKFVEDMKKDLELDSIKKDIDLIEQNLTKEINESIKTVLIEMTSSTISSTVDHLFESGEFQPDEIKKEVQNALIKTTNFLIPNTLNQLYISGQKQIYEILESRMMTIKESMEKKFLGAVKLLLSDTQMENRLNIEKERITLIPVSIISVIIIIVSIFFKPAWRQQAIDDLKTGFTAITENNVETARTIAEKYYNSEKILNTGDVLYLNGLVEITESPQTAMQFIIKANDWYDHHKSWISQNYHGDSYYHLSEMYMNGTTPDYYKANNAIDKALKLDPINRDYQNLQGKIKGNLVKYEEEKNIGFFKRIWNKIRSRF
jgi:hypothetical protein